MVGSEGVIIEEQSTLEPTEASPADEMPAVPEPPAADDAAEAAGDAAGEAADAASDAST